MTFGATGAGASSADFGSQVCRRHAAYRGEAADGLLVAGSSVGNSEGRPETASIKSVQSVMLAVLERLEAGPA